MESKISQLAKAIRPSLMFKILEKAKEMEGRGIEIIHLEKGELEVGTPKEIVDAGKEAMEKGFTTLTPSMGYIQLREAIANFLLDEYALIVNPEKEVLVVPGAKFGVYAAIGAICDSGDEVLCPSPFFPPHREAVEIIGGRFIPIPIIHDGNRIELNCSDLEKRMSPKTRALLLNYPHNPTGWVPSEKELEAIIHFAAENKLTVISDDVYDQLNFDGIKHKIIPSFNLIRNDSIYVNSFSKSFAMTGWRLAYSVAKTEYITAMVRIQQNVTTCASSISQYAGIQGIQKARYFPHGLAKIYGERRDFLVRELSKIPKIYPINPKGAFFIFIDISQLGVSSIEFADQILENGHIALTPGKAFGDEWDNYIRISMTENIDKLDTALKRFEAFVTRL